MWKKISAIYDRLERKLRLAIRPVETNVSMTSGKSSVSITSPPDLDDFDPIREIKRLRQDLAHRLRDLQERNAECDSVKSQEQEELLDAPTEEVLEEETANSIGHHMWQTKKILAHLQVRTGTRQRSGNGEVRALEKEPTTRRVVEKRSTEPLSRKDERVFQRDLAHLFSLDKKIDAPSERPDLLKWTQAVLTAFGLFFMAVGIILCVPKDIRHIATIFLLSGVLMAGAGFLGRFLETTLHRNEL